MSPRPRFLPIRRGPEPPFRWVVDSMIAIVLWIIGTKFAGLITMASIDYTISLLIGWCPLVLWMHYCGVIRLPGLPATLMVVCVVAFAISPVMDFSMKNLVFSLIVLAFVLPIEIVIGRLILGSLPSSSGIKKKAEPR